MTNQMQGVIKVHTEEGVYTLGEVNAKGERGVALSTHALAFTRCIVLGSGKPLLTQHHSQPDYEVENENKLVVGKYLIVQTLDRFENIVYTTAEILAVEYMIDFMQKLQVETASGSTYVLEAADENGHRTVYKTVGYGLGFSKCILLGPAMLHGLGLMLNTEKKGQAMVGVRMVLDPLDINTTQKWGTTTVTHIQLL